jgi:hypothetical protein
MNSMFSRTLKALLAVAVVGVVVACGSSTTVDPFKPTRVIGLGDAYNDTSNAQYTVRGTDQTITTVVAQVAALYGASTVESHASSTYATTNDLITQASQLGSLSDTADLVVITAGTKELKAAILAGGTGTSSGTTFLGNLKTVLDTLKGKGAKHIVIMEVVDITTASSADQPTLDFNTVVKAGLGNYADVARYGNINRPSAYFPSWATTGATPFCVTPTTLDGCDFTEVGNATGDVATYFLADNLNPTPAGNQWLGTQLYNGTGGGWR